MLLTEYLNTSYRPECEFLDGQLLERNVGEWDHSRLQALMSGYLGQREEQWGIIVLIAIRIQVSPTRIRVPDIAVLSASARYEQIITAPPLLCVEILSPDDRMIEMQGRIDDYLSFGVPCVWVIDPRTKRAFIYTPDRVQEIKDGVLTTDNPPIRVPLFELII